MASVLVAPDVCRYVIEGTYLSKPCLNVLDMVVQAGDSPVVPRSEVIPEVAKLLIDNWKNKICTNVSSDYTFNAVSWVDLDTADGQTGSRTSSPTYNLPQSGSRPGDPITAAVAILITKETTASRGLRPGRWFIGGLTEGDVSGNIINGSYLGDFNTALGDMVTNLTETGLLEPMHYFPTVVHTKTTGTGASKVTTYKGNTQITNLRASGRVSTQRRRNRG